MLWTQHLIVDLPIFHLTFFLRLPPFLSLGDCFFVFPLFVRLFSVSLYFLRCSVLTPWIYGVNFCDRIPVRFSGTVSWSPRLTDLGLCFMLALCMSLVFGCCWDFLWWVLPTSWLSEGQSVSHLLYSVVQVWAGCVGAGSSVLQAFEAFLLLLFHCLFLVISFLFICIFR